jgi:ABC-type dipeptide/oligopeptide/nickel transport system ATPase component
MSPSHTPARSQRKTLSVRNVPLKILAGHTVVIVREIGSGKSIINEPLNRGLRTNPG